MTSTLIFIQKSVVSREWLFTLSGHYSKSGMTGAREDRHKSGADEASSGSKEADGTASVLSESSVLSHQRVDFPLSV